MPSHTYNYVLHLDLLLRAFAPPKSRIGCEQRKVWMKQLQVVLCSLLYIYVYPDEEKTREATKQTSMDKVMNPSAREARRVSPANAGNSFFIECS